MAKWNAAANEIFLQALEHDSLDGRRAYLNKACGTDAKLRAEVESLVEAHGHIGGFLESPPSEVTAAITQPIAERPGQSIGRYNLLEEIGEGGFGMVYMAEQREPVRRKVALKIIKPGMDSKQVIARFRAEQQALAMMDHLNIAKVHDAGATESGRPYFVMELVHGTPLTEYCDRNELTTDQRLELFASVCQAVQHAHQKGIIHRDIKPSNVMVALQDGVPVPKIIDFGIAKATDRHLTEKTVFTSCGQMLGTPLYMSPEQAEMSGVDIDTRSDIYSLGVLLYELLTGSTPFDKERIREAAYDEMRRIIREEDPATPSDKISTLGERATAISACRKTDPASLGHLLRGELDWIVMMALEKDRTRRYETANAFAKDIQRYLNDEAVEACPPSTTYRLRKLAWRNRVILTTALFVSAALIGGTVVSVWQAFAAIEARRLSDDRLIEANTQQERAERAAEEAQGNEAYARQTVYAADVRLAAQAWHTGDVRFFADLLHRHTPTEGKEDLRGFEWRYLHQLGHADHRTIDEGTGGTCCARHSPDGKYLVTGRHDGTLCVWNGQSHVPIATLRGHEGLLRGIGFSPDGLTMSTIGDDGVIRLWDAARWKLIRSFPAHDGIGFHVCYAMGGTTLISCGEEPVIRLWDSSTGTPLDTFSEHTDSVEAMAISPDALRCVSAARDGGICIWDPRTCEPVHWLEKASWNYRARCCCFSADGAWVAVGATNKHIYVWNTDTGIQVKSFRGHEDDIQDVAFHPTGTMLASCDRAGVIRTWVFDPTGQAAQENNGESDESAEAGPKADDQRAEAQLARMDLTSRKWPSRFQGHSGRAWSIDFAPRGSRLVSASKDGTVRAWTGRAPTRQLVPGSTCATALTFSPCGSQLIFGVGGEIRALNRSTYEICRFGQRFSEEVLCVAASRDGETIATGHRDGIIRFWDWATGELERVVSDHNDDVDRIAFSPNGTMVITASWDGTARLWETGSGKQVAVRSMPPHCLDAAFSPNGRLQAISSENDAYLFGDDLQARLHVLHGHQNTVSCVAFSPDGRWLATGSHDRTVRIWDVRTGKERHRIPSHREKITALAFSPDGRSIATGDEQGMLTFSHVETGRPLLNIKTADSRIWRLEFSPDGNELAVAAAIREVLLLRTDPTGANKDDSPSAEQDLGGNHDVTVKTLASDPQRLTEKKSAR